ncbi:hypothetical protein ABQF34_03685 [Mycolicibacterium boenickei]
MPGRTLLPTDREHVDAGHKTRLPALVHVVAAGIFLMGTTEFMLAGLLPDVASDLGVDVTRAGLLITAFAVGMIIGPPVMALATLRLPARATLPGAGHVDLYDRVDLIPFDTLTSFFREQLTRR